MHASNWNCLTVNVASPNPLLAVSQDHRVRILGIKTSLPPPHHSGQRDTVGEWGEGENGDKITTCHVMRLPLNSMTPLSLFEIVLLFFFHLVQEGRRLSKFSQPCRSPVCLCNSPAPSWLCKTWGSPANAGCASVVLGRT